MPQYQITPWKYHRELVQARKELYQLGNSTPEDRRHGVDLVHAWSIRGHIPHAVESTALLVDAILHHDNKHNSSFSVRATYAAAFSRFVTGFCDIRQDSNYKRNMFEIAQEIGMPASFVELRHEATHEELPSLMRIARMTKLALDWLWQYYWVKIDEPRIDSVAIEANADSINSHEIQQVITQFLKRRIEEIRNLKRDHTVLEPAAHDACIKLVHGCKGDVDNFRILCTLLVRRKVMIPNDRNLGDSLAGAFEIWSRFLSQLCLHQQQLLPVLISHMLSLLTSPTPLDAHLDPFRESLYVWLLHIFTDKDWMEVRQRHDSVIREAVVKAAVLEPNIWLTLLAKQVFEDGTSDFKDQWKIHLKLLDEEKD